MWSLYQLARFWVPDTREVFKPFCGPQVTSCLESLWKGSLFLWYAFPGNRNVGYCFCYFRYTRSRLCDDPRDLSPKRC